jgi:hypothetical protein
MNMIKNLVIILLAAMSLFMAFVSGLYFSVHDDDDSESHRQLIAAKRSLQIAHKFRANMDEEAYAHLEGEAFLALPHAHYLANSPSTPENLRQIAVTLEKSLLTYFSTNTPPVKQIPNDFFDDQDSMTQENRLEMRKWLEQVEATQIEALKILNASKDQK